MPSANGVYSLPPGYLAITGVTILPSQHNPPLEDIAAALTARLSRDGTAAMTGPLQFTSGAATAPGAVFSADLTTGFYKTTTGIGVAVAGTQVAEFVPGGIKGSRFIGELIPCTLRSPPPLCVFPYGQTLSRTTYADLWAVAQAEIAAGNTFYNNRDGSTTFGIGDLRGRTLAAPDNMGGTAANRLTATYFATPNVIGASGGAQFVSLSQSHLPNVNFTVIQSPHDHPYAGAGINGTVAVQGGGGGPAVTSINPIGTGNAFATGTATIGLTVNSGGSSAGINNIQPTLLIPYALYTGAPS